jgi:hypothetical protein
MNRCVSLIGVNADFHSRAALSTVTPRVLHELGIWAVLPQPETSKPEKRASPASVWLQYAPPGGTGVCVDSGSSCAVLFVSAV